MAEALSSTAAEPLPNSHPELTLERWVVRENFSDEPLGKVMKKVLRKMYLDSLKGLLASTVLSESYSKDNDILTFVPFVIEISYF